jgi:hypothetical protein
MELVLKMPQGKPPFLGVVFDNVREACSLNQDLVNEHASSVYTISIEHSGIHVNIRLVCEDPHYIRVYKNVKCDPKKLENFMYLNRLAANFNFSHLLRDFDREIVVKTLGRYKLFVLKIQGVYLVG